MFIYGEANVDQVMADVEHWIDSYDFNRPGRDGSLGRDIAHNVVEEIQDRSLTHRQGCEVVWPENSDKEPGKYRTRKEQKYGTSEPNSRTGDMLSKRAVYGETRIEPELITMVYGTGDIPTSAALGGSVTGAQLAKSDSKTDKEKAYYAHTGQSKRKILRPFYELDEKISADIREMIADDLNKYIDETKHV